MRSTAEFIQSSTPAPWASALESFQAPGSAGAGQPEQQLFSMCLQAHVSSLALPAVCNAMRKHPKEAEVQAKAMVVMGVLAQGEDSVHDAIRYRQLSAKAPVLIADCMKAFGSSNDEVEPSSP